MLYKLKIMLTPMIKHLADTIPGIILASISLSTISISISMISGLAALFYTGLKTYDWFCAHKNSSNKEDKS